MQKRETCQKRSFLIPYKQAKLEGKIPSVYASTLCSQPFPFFQLLYTISTQ